jgi:hypothetical protein
MFWNVLGHTLSLDQNTTCIILHNTINNIHKITHKCVMCLNKLNERMNCFYMGMTHINPITTSMLQRYSRFVFVAITCFKSLFMWITKLLYSTNIFFTGDNLEIHLVLTLCSNFKPLISSSLARLLCSRCFFGEEK